MHFAGGWGRAVRWCVCVCLCMALRVVDEIDMLMMKGQGVSVNAFCGGVGRGCALVCMRLFVYGAAGGGRD